MFIIECVEIQGQSGNMMYQSGDAVFTDNLSRAASYNTLGEAQDQIDVMDQVLTYVIVEV